MGEGLRFFTIITQNTRANNPSLVDIVKVPDQHSPETPMHPYSGALLHAPRNRGYAVHHHPPNAPLQPDGLQEARLSDYITHPGGGCRLAYKKHTSWTPLVSPLNLPRNCRSATTCAVELTFFNGTKAAIISYYLPQMVEANSITCDAMSQLPHSLPHSLIILG